MKSKKQKQKDLEALTEQFQNAKAAMLVGFQKMTVSKDQELRNQLREAGVSYEVVKNTLARKASQGTVIEAAQEHFKGDLKVYESQSRDLYIQSWRGRRQGRRS